VGRLGSEVCVSASFRMLAFTAEPGEYPRWGGKLSRRGNVRRDMSEGEMSYTTDNS